MLEFITIIALGSIFLIPENAKDRKKYGQNRIIKIGM
jgi:hypothetical protein